MDFIAPAKLNLYLQVIHKRDDGYHEIETVFERISLYDKISIEVVNSSGKIACNDPGIFVNGGSLMGRTVSLFTKASGSELNFDIFVEKHIPVGAGLGGGSSDVATILMGLNKLAGNPLEKDELFDIGSKLGADVPFFISENSFGQGKGRGDIIRHINTKAKLWHILVNPAFEVSTKDVYGKIFPFDLTKERSIDRMVSTFSDRDIAEAISKNLYNDLQLIVLRDFPVLKKVLLELKNSGAKGVLLSGSGPTCFGVYDEKNVEKAAERLRKVFSEENKWKILVTHTY